MTPRLKPALQGAGLLSVVVLLSACAMRPPAAAPVSALVLADRLPLRVDAAQSGVHLLLSPDQALEVSLPSNPSTGYRWMRCGVSGAAMTAEGEPRFLQSVADTGLAEAGLVGVPGTEIWRFRASAAGEQTLCFSYQRRHDADAAQAVTFSITVR